MPPIWRHPRIGSLDFSFVRSFERTIVPSYHSPSEYSPLPTNMRVLLGMHIHS